MHSAVFAVMNSPVIEFGVNDGGGNGAGCFDVEEWVDTTELTDVEVAGLGKCSFLVGEIRCSSKMKPRL